MSKILIVEDEKPLVTLLKTKLSQEGFDVIEAYDGVEGLELALTKHPDLILLDIIMPKMDGMTVLHKLRQDAWGKDAKVILLTNLSYEEKEKQAQAEGINDYLVKTNWSLDDVVKKINQYLTP